MNVMDAEDRPRTPLVVHTQGYLVLAHRLDVRVNLLITETWNESVSERIRRTREPEVTAREVIRIQAEHSGCIQGAITDTANQSAKHVAGQRELRPVIESPPAAIDLNHSVAAQVIARSKVWTDLIVPS